MYYKRDVPDRPIIGNSRDLSERVLPTRSDEMKCYLHERHTIKLTTNKDPSVSEISEPIVMKIKCLWNKASILCVFHNRIKNMISNYHIKYRSILRSMKGKKDNAKFKDQCSKFKSQADKTLLDMPTCKCRSFSTFSCARNRKILKTKPAFLTDQTTSKKMAILEVDTSVLKKTSDPAKKKKQI